MCGISRLGVINNLIIRRILGYETIEKGLHVYESLLEINQKITESIRSAAWPPGETKNRVSTDRLKRFFIKTTERREKSKTLIGSQQKNRQN